MLTLFYIEEQLPLVLYLMFIFSYSYLKSLVRTRIMEWIYENVITLNFITSSLGKLIVIINLLVSVSVLCAIKLSNLNISIDRY